MQGSDALMFARTLKMWYFIRTKALPSRDDSLERTGKNTCIDVLTIILLVKPLVVVCHYQKVKVIYFQ